MAINKITPRALDKSSDYKLVPSTAFIDAVNVVMADEEAGFDSEGGSSGVIKNLRGTTALTYHTSKDIIADGAFKIIGSTTDHKMKLIYFFVYHEDLNEQGVWVYDPYGRLSLPVKWAVHNSYYEIPLYSNVDPYQKGTIKCVVKGDFFNFKQNSVVQGNVIYGNTLNVPSIVADAIRSGSSPNGFSVTNSDRNTFEKDFHLYFTDNKNEPKKINVGASMFARALANDSFEFGGVNPELAALDFDGDNVFSPSDHEVYLAAVGISGTPGNPVQWEYDGQEYYVSDFSVLDLDGDGTITSEDALNALALTGTTIVPATVVPGTTAFFQSDEGGFFSVPGLNSPEVEKIKFCHACKPTPLSRPTFSWIEDPSSKANNFEKSEGFKFAYQVIYNDGSTSSVSPKSEIAVPPSLLFQGNDKNPNHSLYNVCQIKISDETIGLNLWNHVKQVNILAQEGIGPFKIVHEAKGPNGVINFNFKNDIVGIPISEKEENKFFDSVPQKAEAQAVVDNRLMYGNYVEGYPNHPVQASLSVDYADRPAENFGSPLKVEKSIMLETATSGENDVKQKTSGFRITVADGDFPDLEVGDVLNFSLNFLPQRNFHVYNATESYHQSRHLGVENGDGDGNTGSYESVNFYHQTPAEAGVNYLLPFSAEGEEVAFDNNVGSMPQIYAGSFNAFKSNGGVAQLNWRTVDSVGTIPSTMSVSVGTSAANPFIIPSDDLSFSVRLRCIQASDGDTLRSNFFKILDKVFGSRGNPFGFTDYDNAYFSVIEYKPYSTTTWDLPIQNGQRFSEGDAVTKLISMVTNSVNVPGPGGVLGPKCRGAVIAKKGQATFALRRTDYLEESAQQQDFLDNAAANKAREYKIVLDNIPTEGLELWTAVRKWMPDSPWWFLSPSFMSSVANGDSTLDSFYTSSIYNGGTNFGPTVTGVSNVTFNDLLPSGFDGEHLFKQYLSAYDFNLPPLLYQASSPSGALGPVNQKLLDAEMEGADFTSRTIFGFAESFDDISPITPPNTVSQYRFFISTPSPEPLYEEGIAVQGGAFFSLMDGEGGPGGTLLGDSLPGDYQYPEASNGKNPIMLGLNLASSAYGFVPSYYPFTGFATANTLGFFGPWFTGLIHSNSRMLEDDLSDGLGFFTSSVVNISGDNQDTGIDKFGGRTTMPLIQGSPRGVVRTNSSNRIFLSSKNEVFSYKYTLETDDADNGWDDYNKLNFSFNLDNSFIEFLSQPIFQVSSASGGGISGNVFNRSFKASSDHDFGVVFYDSHGRRSFVNPIGSVYVDGFGSVNRSGRYGTASVRVSLAGNPPSWADKYQIVYGGNKSVSDFVQYTTNNAFIEPTNNTDLEAQEEAVSLQSGKIYVSLNLLQSSSISYAKEFGARGEDGSTSVYKYQDGDKLRIISYGDESQRVYPSNAVFDVIEVVSLDPTLVDSNPLVNDLDDPGSELFGDFAVISNNELVENFAYSDLLAGGSAWDQNVVFEIYNPKKATGVESQLYHEIGDVYDTLDSGFGNKIYSQTSISVYEGDVFFRPVAANLNLHDDVDWTDILSVDEDGVDGNVDYNSNFQNILLESPRTTDLFPSKMKSVGRPNIASSNAKTVRREAGIIYSEKSNPESDNFNYSSFNASLFPFKDLEERFGNINFIDELGGNLFVIQQDRCTKVPVSSTILANVVGQEQLIASNDILGKEQVFSVMAGCDNNPESVVRIDNTYYFAHKSSGKVFRFVDGQGLENISDVQMSSYLRSKFRNAIQQSEINNQEDIRIVGGYDPVKQEYLLSILDPQPIESVSSDSNDVLGCINPDAVNYNPEATINDGTCIFVDDLLPCMVSTSADLDGNVSHNFGNLSLDSTTDITIPIYNTGSSDLLLSDPAVSQSEDGTFSAVLESYSVAPGEFTNLKVYASGESLGNATGTITLQTGNGSNESPCTRIITVNTSVDVFSGAGVPEQFLYVNLYIGGTLIDQQFASTARGLWEITVNQHDVIRRVKNSYSGIGNRALIEAEVIMDQGAATPPTDLDKISISAIIDEDQQDFKFVQRGADEDQLFIDVLEEKKFEASIPATAVFPHQSGVRFPICFVSYPDIVDGLNIFEYPKREFFAGRINFNKFSQVNGYRLFSATTIYDQENISVKNGAFVEVRETDQIESTFNFANLDKDQDGVISAEDIDFFYSNIPFYNAALDINNDGIVDEQDFLLAKEFIGQIVFQTDPGVIPPDPPPPPTPGLVLDLDCFTYNEGDAVWEDQTQNEYHFTASETLPIKNSDGSVLVGRGPLGIKTVEEFELATQTFNERRFFFRGGMDFEEDGTVTRRDKFIADTDQKFSYEFIFRYNKQPIDEEFHVGNGVTPKFDKFHDIFRYHGRVHEGAFSVPLLYLQQFTPAIAEGPEFGCSRFIGYANYASGGWSFGTRWKSFAEDSSPYPDKIVPYEGLAGRTYFGKGEGRSGLAPSDALEFASMGNDVSITGYDFGIYTGLDNFFSTVGESYAQNPTNSFAQNFPEVMNIVQVTFDPEAGVSKMYVNGELRTTRTDNVGIGLPNDLQDLQPNGGFDIGTFLIGKSPQGGWGDPSGLDVYMLRVYDIALNEDEVMQNYQEYTQKYIPS